MKIWMPLLTSTLLLMSAGCTYRSAHADDSHRLFDAGTPKDWGQPVLVDEFGGTKLDRKKWYVYDSPTARPPSPRRAPESVKVERGTLKLTGHISEKYGDVSGGIGSRYSASYGRWEVRLRADRGLGYSPVVLLWPTSERWPDEGEIDILEIPDGSRKTGDLWLHYGADNHKKHQQVRTDFTLWHTVALDWLPDHITYRIDNRVVWTVKRDPDSSKNLVPHTPFRMALQNDQGCQGQCRRNDETPKYVTMFVDWVKVYKARERG